MLSGNLTDEEKSVQLNKTDIASLKRSETIKLLHTSIGSECVEGLRTSKPTRDPSWPGAGMNNRQLSAWITSLYSSCVLHLWEFLGSILNPELVCDVIATSSSVPSTRCQLFLYILNVEWHMVDSFCKTAHCRFILLMYRVEVVYSSLIFIQPLTFFEWTRNIII